MNELEIISPVISGMRLTNSSSGWPWPVEPSRSSVLIS